MIGTFKLILTKPLMLSTSRRLYWPGRLPLKPPVL